MSAHIASSHAAAPPAAPLRVLPSVDAVLKAELARAATDRHGRQATTAAVRTALDERRAALRAGAGGPATPDEIAASALARLDAAAAPSLRPVFNLTGTVLHTNLGRAIFAEEAVEAAVRAMRSAVTLEYDLDGGKRGERDDHVRGLVCELTGAEDATLVNNNAAAVLLVLNTLSQGKPAIVSRGELIEIGGAFRMPEIMRRAGAELDEVGTTNRTHARDYRDAIRPETGVILKVHTSNYRIEGFTKEVSPRELAEIAQAGGVPLVNDLGSGTLADLTRYGLVHEPTVREAVAEGADIVTFSGDKLLGGPQAGFIVGRRDLIARINKNPMKRALRLDKVRLAAIEATLRLYRDPDRLAERLPTLRYLTRHPEDMAAQAARLAPVLATLLGPAFTVDETSCRSQIGSGALPLETLEGVGLAIASRDGSGGALNRLADRLRRLPVPVIGRIDDNALVLDLRCLEDEAAFLASVTALEGAHELA
ncbi:UNVERIFIED_ORG: L-seryl-tRNA(Ser) seleniumtransferase [Xanthobacter viscosus]|uniref:L-seryl-tRNA(Sec) selenium transferase n=1 Tax=Xanthobacter autotrophicus TaxID=280 RepID=A0A6C1KBY2_XANAU|nr:L-seryl-tRNA(Sec) selenium transferase [Xanthobacter autotrophicus]TLX40754.1 L-seryl-tRNA(Sec) selenium transferase [Xanthobacter autotrophicus]